MALSRLENEHRVIEKALDILQKMISVSHPVDRIDLEFLVQFFQGYAGELHHGKEEDILFPKLLQHGLSHQGGPNCTLYFGRLLEHMYPQKIQDLVRTSGRTIDPRKVSTSIAKIVEDQHPLSIPVKEHDAGHLATKFLQILARETPSPKNDREIRQMSRLYLGLLREHIQKEDNCLFRLVETTLSPEEVDELNDKMDQIDSSKADEIESFESRVAELRKKHEKSPLR